MKKIFAVSLLLFYGLISWISFDYVAETASSLYTPGTRTIVTLEIAPQEKLNYLNDIYQLSASMNIPLEQYSYDYSQKNISIFTTVPDTYIDHLISGKLPHSRGEFISTKNTNNHSQVGNLLHYKNDNEVCIYHFSSFLPQSHNIQFYLQTTDNLAEEFCTNINLLNNGNSYFSYISGTNNSSSNVSISLLIVQKKDLLVIAFIILLLLSTYVLFLSSKEYSLKRTLGYSYIQTLIEPMYKLFIPLSIISCILVLFLSVVLLFFRNALFLSKYFFKSFFVIAGVFTFLLYTFMFISNLYLSRQFVASNILKNKFPGKKLFFLACGCKVIIAYIAVSILATTISAANLQSIYSNRQDRWDALKNYVEFPIHSNDEETNSTFYYLGEKCKSLFELENNRGGILINPTGYLASSAQFSNHSDPEKPYFLVNNYVKINNNYLKINPILGIDGEPVDFPDEYDDCIHVLMPEKYMKYENQFMQELFEFANMTYYISEDMYIKEQGRTPIQHNDRKVLITYVNNQQSYFTYSPNNAIKSDFTLYDPIALIVNNENFGGDTYLSAFSSGDFKAKAPNRNSEIDYFTDNIHKSGLNENIFYIENSYTRVSEKIYTIERNLYRGLIIESMCWLVFIVISIISTVAMYLSNQKTIFVKRFLGYSKLKCCLKFYIYTVGFWVMFFAFLSLLFRRNIQNLFLICVFAIITEFVLITLIVNSNLKLRRYLKGEGV